MMFRKSLFILLFLSSVVFVSGSTYDWVRPLPYCVDGVCAGGLVIPGDLNVTGETTVTNITVIEINSIGNITMNNNSVVDAQSIETHFIRNPNGGIEIQSGGEGNINLFQDKIYGAGEDGNILKLWRKDGADNYLSFELINTLNAAVIRFSSRLWIYKDADLVMNIVASGPGINQDKYWLSGTGTGGQSKMGISTNGDQNALLIGAPDGVAGGSKNIVIAPYGLLGFRDYDHPVNENPTLYIQSETDPNTDNTQWGSISFNNDTAEGNSFDITVGSGTINLSADTRIEGNINVTKNIYSENNIYFNVTQEIAIPINKLKLPGINPPEDDIIGLFPVLKFDKNTNESAYTTMHIIPNYKDGTDFHIEFYWSPVDNGAGSVVWCVELIGLEQNNGELLTGATNTYCAEDTTTSTQDELLEGSRITVSGAGVKKDEQFGFRIHRGASMSADTYANDASLVTAQIYYTSESMGI